MQFEGGSGRVHDGLRIPRTHAMGGERALGGVSTWLGALL
jgi:hypothetical protein